MICHNKFSSRDIEDLTLLLLYLNSWDENRKKDFGDKPILRSWKNHRFETIDSLVQSGLIRHGVKDKSIYLTEKGTEVAKEIASRLTYSSPTAKEDIANRSENIIINGKEVEIIYKDVKRPTYTEIGGKYKLTIPSSFSEHQKDHVMEAFKKRLEGGQKKRFVEIYKEFKDGDIIDLGDKKYTLKIDFIDKKSSSAKLVKDIIHLFISSNLSDENKKIHVYELIRKIVSKQKKHFLKQKIQELNKKYFNVKFSDVNWKKQTSRWGSCSENGNINISYKLLFAPADVLEYVCVHELAHLIEPNHSENFWKLVEAAMPNYKEKEEWLKANGHELDQ